MNTVKEMEERDAPVHSDRVDLLICHLDYQCVTFSNLHRGAWEQAIHCGYSHSVTICGICCVLNLQHVTDNISNQHRRTFLRLATSGLCTHM
jgi:hypothetical protein